MRAIVQSGFGVAADVLTVAEVAKPLAGPGEVLVQIEAAGVAKGNWLITRGLPYIARPMYGVLTPKHRVAGLQFAGTVAALGEGVDGFEIGEAHEGETVTVTRGERSIGFVRYDIEGFPARVTRKFGLA